MNEDKNVEKDDVVVILDPKDFILEEWKVVPGFSSYLASNYGEVKKRLTDGSLVKVKFRPMKTSVGTYLTASIIDDAGVIRFKSCHLLVCLAFHGEPPSDGQQYDVNHKDLDKHNNRASNLEWLTHSDNCLHALRAGARKDNLIVDAYNHETNEWVEFYSISEMARRLGINRNDAKYLLSKPSVGPFNGKWSFQLRHDRLDMISKPSHVIVQAKDYLTGEIIETDNATTMQYKTGVNSVTIISRIGKKKYIPKDLDAMINGYVFRKGDDLRPWPKHSLEDAVKSRELYSRRISLPKKYSIDVKDYIKETVTRYNNIQSASKATGILYATIVTRLAEKDLVLCRGFCFKRSNDERNFPDFHPLRVKKSLLTHNHALPCYEITDHETSTTEIYYLLTDFIKKHDLPHRDFKTILATINRKYPGRFEIKEISHS